MHEPRRLLWIGSIGLSVLIFLWAGATGVVDSARFGALTGGVQAIGVVVALGLGAATLLRDSRDRRVDRVLALHEELMTGELWHARHRLVRHLRSLGAEGKARAVSRAELMNDPDVSHYDGGTEATPLMDADLLVRFFERANAVLVAGSVHEPMFVDLIGRHTFWWNTAIRAAPEWTTREHLTDLKNWTSRYIHNELRGRPMPSWTQSVVRDFGSDGHTTRDDSTTSAT